MNDLIVQTRQFVTTLLTTKLPHQYYYRTKSFTQRVVDATHELIENTKLGTKEKEQLLLAAWFQSVGCCDDSSDVQMASCEIAKRFLTEIEYPETDQKAVCKLILVTKNGIIPENEFEKIIKDAYASDLSSKGFPELMELLREELKALKVVSYNPNEWRDYVIDFLNKKHYYFTTYGKENWKKRKNKNLKKLLKSKKKQRKKYRKEQLKAKYKAKYKRESPDRGVQTMYRVTMRNHLKLSDIADTKANILLSVNAIIISLMLSNLIPKLDNPSNDYLIYPTAIFVLFSVASMVMSVLATRPDITNGEFTVEDVEKKRVNILFFGNFHKMRLSDYEWAMKELIQDKQYLYNSLTKDLYYLGLVLNRKYLLLRWTYSIFMIGIIVSVLVFGVALKYFGPDRIL